MSAVIAVVAVCVGGHCCGSGLCRRSLLWKRFVSAGWGLEIIQARDGDEAIHSVTRARLLNCWLFALS